MNDFDEMVCELALEKVASSLETAYKAFILGAKRHATPFAKELEPEAKAYFKHIAKHLERKAAASGKKGLKYSAKKAYQYGLNEHAIGQYSKWMRTPRNMGKTIERFTKGGHSLSRGGQNIPWHEAIEQSSRA